MVSCKHTALEFLPARKRTLRCRHCHLTLDGEELGDGYCPECYDQSGERRYDFDELEALDDGAAKYRCEECGAIKFVARRGTVISSKLFREEGARSYQARYMISKICRRVSAVSRPRARSAVAQMRSQKAIIA